MISCSSHLFIGISWWVSHHETSMTIPSIGPFQGLDLAEVFWNLYWFSWWCSAGPTWHKGNNWSTKSLTRTRPRVSHFTSRWTTGWAWRKLKADNRCTWQQRNSYVHTSSSLMFFVSLAVVLTRCQLFWCFRLRSSLDDLGFRLMHLNSCCNVLWESTLFRMGSNEVK